jgi:SAM-dependent methyltransferase
VEADVAFYVKEARRSGGPVLELGCGTGRVSVPIAEAGIEVVGLDLSPHMLQIARTKARGLPFTVRRGDMARFDLGRRFGLALIPFRAFQHLLTIERQRSCLRSVRRHLRRDGRLILALFDPRLDLILPGKVAPQGRPAVRFSDGRRVQVVVTERVNDPLTQTFRELWTWTERDRRGRVVRRTQDVLRLRWTYRYEMQHLLELEGFEPIACYGDFRRGPPRYGAEQVWVARRA